MIAYALNLFDMAFTICALHCGAQELNPLMRWLMQWPALFMGYKIAVVGLLLAGLYRLAEGGNTFARWGIRLCTAVYAAVALHHIAGLTMILT